MALTALMNVRPSIDRRPVWPPAPLRPGPPSLAAGRRFLPSEPLSDGAGGMASGNWLERIAHRYHLPISVPTNYTDLVQWMEDANRELWRFFRSHRRIAQAEGIKLFAVSRNSQATAFVYAAKVKDWPAILARDPLGSLTPEAWRDWLIGQLVYLSRPSREPIMLELHRASCFHRDGAEYPHPLVVLALAKPARTYLPTTGSEKTFKLYPGIPDDGASPLPVSPTNPRLFHRTATAGAGGWVEERRYGDQTAHHAATNCRVNPAHPPEHLALLFKERLRSFTYRKGFTSRETPWGIPDRLRRQTSRSVALWSIWRFCQVPERGLPGVYAVSDLLKLPAFSRAFRGSPAYRV